MIGVSIFALCSGFRGTELAAFIIILAIGIMVSEIIGALIGILCGNQMSATSITVPVMMVFSFLPMLSLFNDTIKSISKYTYSQQISLLINNIADKEYYKDGIIIILSNLIIAAILFSMVFRKRGLNE
ncbi:MAG: hypothetical protein IJ661_07945 [Lachnospiraceae bacterium]|nr:hypothetical protein [Lachnospiraceae bacterium]